MMEEYPYQLPHPMGGTDSEPEPREKKITAGGAMLKHYVEYLYPGIIVSENSYEEVSHRDATLIRLPERAFGFRFCDREERQHGDELLLGKYKNHTAWSMKGQVLTADEVRSQYPSERILIGNMERNQVARVCRTEFGQFIPLSEEDTVIPTS